MTYQFTQGDTILRIADGAFIPCDLSNSDYVAYLDWLEEGNTPDPDPTTANYTWDQVLQKRNQLLHDSDWTMIPGCTVDQHAWAVYRQVLRDLPQTFAGCNPLDVIWPEKPATAGPNKRQEQEQQEQEQKQQEQEQQESELVVILEKPEEKEEATIELVEPVDVKIEFTEEK